ncbi:MAG: hypothetical protein ACKO96_16935, partial [Flammeovirgaceae bacterium]
PKTPKPLSLVVIININFMEKDEVPAFQTFFKAYLSAIPLATGGMSGSLKFGSPTLMSPFATFT